MLQVVVMGSKAYEYVVLTNLDTYDGKKIIVSISSKLEKSVEFINGDICRKVLELKNEHPCT
jgi:hypothetical protein